MDYCILGGWSPYYVSSINLLAFKKKLLLALNHTQESISHWLNGIRLDFCK